MLNLRLFISMAVIATSFSVGCTRSSDPAATPSQLTTQTVASGSFVPERKVTVEEMQELLTFESQDQYFDPGRPAVGWKTKSANTNVDSTYRTMTRVVEKELIEFQGDRAIYKFSSSEADSAGYSLTNQIWIGADSENVKGTQLPIIEISKSPGVETGDPKVKETLSPGSITCRTVRSKKSAPATIELGTYRFADGTVLPIAFRVQENRIVRLLCGEKQGLERRGTSENISIGAPNNVTVFSSTKTRLDNGIFVSSNSQETLIHRDIRTK